SVGAAGDDRNMRLVALGEAAVWLVRPLHRRARAVALRELQIVAHAELVAVAENWRAGQRENQAVGELQPPAVAIEHRSEPPANTAPAELHPGMRPDSPQD